MIKISDLILVADEYIRVTGSKDVTVSYWIFSDSKKLRHLRHGADITVGRFNAALCWFSTNWPDDAAWPAHIQRPFVNVNSEPVAEAAE